MWYFIVAPMITRVLFHISRSVGNNDISIKAMFDGVAEIRLLLPQLFSETSTKTPIKAKC